MTPFDRVLFLRTLAYVALALLLGAAITAVTEEAYTTSAMRVARLAAYTPGIVVIACGAALAQHAARGEFTALAALGVGPWRAARGSVWAGWFAGALAAAALLSPWADGAALLPGIPSELDWSVEPSGFRAPAAGLTVDPAGAMQFGSDTPSAGEAVQATARPAELIPGNVDRQRLVIWAIGPLSALAPVWASSPAWGRAGALRAIRRAAVATIAAFATVIALHAVAAGQLSRSWLLSGGVLLGLDALLAFFRARWFPSRNA
jgi:hypothetical protein